MATKQRDISVSEFFVKNRHLLGFDSPRKALLTTVKEAVDNSLDACEEAGILPEIWVQISATGDTRYTVAIQDNGPGIVKAQIPNIFGKLLYGSKFHRLRQSRGQQGIGISAAGMYGLLTTGKPVKIISKTSNKQPAHYYELQIDTKQNRPEILNNKGDGVEIPAGDAAAAVLAKHGIVWESVPHGTRVTIELEGKYHRGRGSVDEYLSATVIANPHVTLHFIDPDGQKTTYARAAEQLPPEAVEIKPHPYGCELGMLINMLKQSNESTITAFLQKSFSKVNASVAQEICEKAGVSVRANVKKIGRHEAETLFKAIQETKIPPPSTDCVCPIGEPLLLKGLHHVVPADFYVAVTRPPAVYRGNPFVIEVALAFGGAPSVQKISKEALEELMAQSDARTLSAFLRTTFQGVGEEGAKKILAEAHLGSRTTIKGLSPKDVDKLHLAMKHVNLDEGQTGTLLRYANRVPLLYQPGACAVSQAIMTTNWRAYGLSQSRGSMPSGPVTIMVHVASVWVPFTSESKEAIASYPEILKELRLGLQGVGRKLGMYLKRRQKVKQEGERRNVFLRYLGEVARAVGTINQTDWKPLFEKLTLVAKAKTAVADTEFDENGQAILPAEEELDFGDNVIIVDRSAPPSFGGSAPPPAGSAEPDGASESDSDDFDGDAEEDLPDPDEE